MISLIEPCDLRLSSPPTWPAAYDRQEEDVKRFVEACQALFRRPTWDAFCRGKATAWLVVAEDGSARIVESPSIDEVVDGRATDLRLVWLDPIRCVRGRVQADGTVEVFEGRHRAAVAIAHGFTIPVDLSF